MKLASPYNLKTKSKKTKRNIELGIRGWIVQARR
jgi:hypothetical protein